MAEHIVERLLIRAVIGDRGGRILELMAGQDADDAIVGGDDAFLPQLARAGDAGGRGRFAAETAGADLGLGVEDLLIASTSRTTPPQRSSARSAFGRFTGRLISMALAIVAARSFSASSPR